MKFATSLEYVCRVSRQQSPHTFPGTKAGRSSALTAPPCGICSFRSQCLKKGTVRWSSCWRSNLEVACLLRLLARTQSRGPSVTVEEAGRCAGSTLLTKYRTLFLWRETLAVIEKLFSFCQKYFGGIKWEKDFPHLLCIHFILDSL